MTGSPLHGGARRRRRGRVVVAVVLLAVAAVTVVAARDTLLSESESSPPATSDAVSNLQQQQMLGPPPTGPHGIALETADTFRLVFHKKPRAGIVFDLDSGAVLWRRNPVEVRSIASLTKIMTAVVVAKLTKAREEFRVPKAALRYRGSGVGLLPKGRHVSVEALLHGLMLVSGNDAAKALAIQVGRSERRFVRLMNAEARRLGLQCTRFVSPHGLERGNRSCAADLAAMARLAMDEFRIARVVRKSRASLRFPIKGGRLYLNSTNPLLRTRYPGAMGLKTGYTRDAGRCFVAVARRGGRTLGVVLLRSPDPGGQARRLLNRAFHTPPSGA